MRCTSNMKPRFRAEWVVVREELLIMHNNVQKSYRSCNVDIVTRYMWKENSLIHISNTTVGRDIGLVHGTPRRWSCRLSEGPLTSDGYSWDGWKAPVGRSPCWHNCTFWWGYRARTWSPWRGTKKFGSPSFCFVCLSVPVTFCSVSFVRWFFSDVDRT